jgi:hypothetical protein
VAFVLFLDGQLVPAYAPIYLANGHIIGPVVPYVTRVADRIEFDRGDAVFVRGRRSVRIRMLRRDPEMLAQTYVALASVLERLGENVEVDRSRHFIAVTTPGGALRSPEPFDARAAQGAPREVFTPVPVPTPRPVWSGTPRPRRTPIPSGFWATPKPLRGLRR